MILYTLLWCRFFILFYLERLLSLFLQSLGSLLEMVLLIPFLKYILYPIELFVRLGLQIYLNHQPH